MKFLIEIKKCFLSLLSHFFLTAVFLFQSVISTAELNLPDTDIQSNSYLYFQYDAKGKEADGSAYQVLKIRTNNTAKNLSEFDSIEAYCRKSSRPGKQDYMAYRVPVEKLNNEYYVKIKSGNYSIFDVYVSGNYKNNTYVAQTVFYLFGDGLKGSTGKPGLVKLPEYLPVFELTESPQNYWPQTGNEFRFLCRVPEGSGSIKQMIVIIDNKKVSRIFTDRNGKFEYIPAHDIKLNKGGTSSYKEIILLNSINRNGKNYTAAFNLLVHRSRTAFLNVKNGAVLFTVSIIFFTAIVLIKRRTFKYK
ncbi:MAG: hypothetical protein JW864_13720 [Spirochaetes bacterium]|nr:hypothetical protein [Spirochaetota bacterium]